MEPAHFQGRNLEFSLVLRTLHLMPCLCTAIATYCLACVQAVNFNSGIKHIYTTLISLWNFFYYSAKRMESLKEVHCVTDIPELKIKKHSGTRWLAHERCVKAVKASYCVTVIVLDNIHASTHQVLWGCWTR